ncbi:glycosyltransferase [Erythrobacter sp. SCSIO 43205]|uniref:hypothetical protein n=1 Tax=Erythrobacter sp. SCSIO 43205 TaxID=2779361 RepID=UPI001CA9B9B7|nr:hypothetical protein [Erythrobacter sp. SCSIO 43205]UAB77824.1 glycosyltransferase [Erythrobacter sp. SCSIO 43205]
MNALVKIQNSMSSLAARFFKDLMKNRTQFTRGAIKLFGKSGHRGTAISVPPFGRREVVFEYVPKGYYKLSLTHQDRMLHTNRKVLIASISTSKQEPGAQASAELGLPLSDEGEPFSYLGNGHRSRDQFKKSIAIRIDFDRDWVGVRIDSKIDRYLNIDNLRLTPDVINLENTRSSVAPYVSRMLQSRPDLLDAEFILYADINLNVVDGSSVWLSSMLSALSACGKTLLLAKKDITSDIIWSNVTNCENVVTVSPSDFGAGDQTLAPEIAIALIRELDDVLPNVRRVVVRGLKAATILCQNRQFRERSIVYLTDFYEIEDGVVTVQNDTAKHVATIATQSGYLLAQTDALAEKIREVSNTDVTCHSFPPPIPDDLPEISIETQPNDKIRIGYAGKITPLWGADELLDWTMELKEKGIESELHIVANRISDGVGKKNVPGFGDAIREKIQSSAAFHYGDLNREASMNKMASMHFVWCYRPAALENNTLEVSTKLIEMAAAGAACLCYPSRINRELLGDDYPYFIKDIEDFERVLRRGPQVLRKALSDQIKSRHSLANVSRTLAENVLRLGRTTESEQCVVIAGHDFKFIDPYISTLKAHGHRILRDQWEWGGPTDVKKSKRLLDSADIVLCEWGLANAVWHSANKREGTKLFVRIHLQEINERAQKFGLQINKEAVDGYIFVEEGVRRTAIEMFDIPPEKTHLVPNFLLDDEYRDRAFSKHDDDIVTLGMIGITPQRKRFDLAVELLEQIIDSGQPARLLVKGPRPETLEFMRAPGRAHELDYYKQIYTRIEARPELAQAVSFAPWGNDVAAWYRDIDFILSPSDFESFHYALADGILSGCTPLIWPWKGAEQVYSPEWIIQDTQEALLEIQRVRALNKSDQIRESQEKRDLLIKRYGYKQTFGLLSEIIGIEI